MKGQVLNPEFTNVTRQQPLIEGCKGIYKAIAVLPGVFKFVGNIREDKLDFYVEHFREFRSVRKPDSGDIFVTDFYYGDRINLDGSEYRAGV